MLYSADPPRGKRMAIRKKETTFEKNQERKGAGGIIRQNERMSYIKFLKHGKRMGVVAVAGLLALAPVSSTVYAATSAVTTNNTANKE